MIITEIILVQRMLKMATVIPPELYFLLSSIFLHTIQCSVVIDSFHQKGVYVSDYCPKMPYCPEGAHVMCMYYNPDWPMGPRCNKPKNVSITPVLANKLLEVSNAIRSKIALGKEKGKDGNLFPRGYGMFRLQWDSELATFAQVLANQCVLKHDMCRSSKKFPDPGQTAGLVRFTCPDWYPVSNAGHFTKPGLTTAKLSYALTQSLKSWYSQKNYVTANMITNVPNWSDAATNQLGRLYIEMIYGPATHMGCGISAYTEYAYNNKNANLNFNSVQVICNYSSRPRPGQPVFEVHPPTEVGYTVKCGCPPGTDEDADCLCYRNSQNPDDNSVNRRFCSQHNCKPAIVLLPIFTVENAPPEKLISRDRPELSEKQDDDMEILDLYGSGNNISVLHPSENIQDLMNIHAVFDDFIKDVPPNNIQRNVTTRKTIPSDVRNRYFDVKTIQPKNLYQPKRITTKKKRIFSIVPTFDLSHRNSKVTQDVKPRRDFSNAKKIAEQYMIQKRSRLHEKIDSLKHSIKQTKAETYLNSAEEKVMKNYYLNTARSNFTPASLSDLKFGTSTEKSKDKLMNLLDRLEQEVKHIELDGDKKEIFDAKIRKIYGTVVGKPVSLPSPYSDLEFSSNEKHFKTHNEEHYNKKIDHYKNDIEDYENDINTDTRRFKNNHDMRLIERDQYSLKFIDQSKEHGESADKSKSYSKISEPYKSNKINYKSFYIDEDEKRQTIHLQNAATDKLENMFSKHKENNRRIINNKKKAGDETILSPNRRRYYQEKLANLERKLKNTRHNHSRVNSGLHLRPLLPPTRQEEPSEPETKQLDPLYLPDRARYLHGF